MTDTTKTLEVEKQELASSEGLESTRDCPCFVPQADIYEVDDQMVIVCDVPGADENCVEVSLEKNILTINAVIEPVLLEGYTLTFAEYQVGDYHRSFRLSEEIDREKIQAVVKDGVLRLYLPKSSEARTRKIEVKSA